jgi:phosphate transport system protein
MERHFHEELRRLTNRVGDMGALVETRTRDALTALVERRADLAIQVAAGDADVNELELEIDDLCMKFLATQGPLAADLRLVRSVIRVITDLERIGDQAVNMAHTIIGLVGKPPLKPVFDISNLGDIALQMLHESVQSFVTQDVSLVRIVLDREEKADALRDSIFRVLLTHMMSDPAAIERALGLLLVSRSLERIADHATNIAEEAEFVAEGRVIRHRKNALEAE